MPSCDAPLGPRTYGARRISRDMVEAGFLAP